MTWKVLELDGDLRTLDALRLQLAKRPGELGAERALKIGEEHDLDTGRDGI